MTRCPAADHAAAGHDPIPGPLLLTSDTAEALPLLEK